MPRLIALAAPLLIGALLAAAGANEAKPPAPPQSKAPEGPTSREARIRLYERTLRGRLAGGALPLIDMEAALDAWRSPARLINGMNRAGVALAAVSARSGEAIRKAAARHPARLIPLTASGVLKGRADAAGQTAGLGRQLGGGAFGIGRIAWRAAASGDAGAGEALAGVLRLASEAGAPAWVAQPEDDAALARLERLLRAAPGAGIVWTRAGRVENPDAWPGYGHGLLRALSLRYAGLFFTLAQEPPPAPGETPAARKNHLFDPGGALALEWRALLEARAGHLMVGSGAGGPAEYAGRALLFRQKILSKLSRAAAARIAWRNAWRLLTRRAWKP